MEITRLGPEFGVRPEIFSGLAGIGGLVVICPSPLNRDQTFGRRLGKGTSVAEAIVASRGVAGGVKSARVALDLARAYDVDVSIIAGAVTAVEGAASIAQVAGVLLARPHKPEGVHATSLQV